MGTTRKAEPCRPPVPPGKELKGRPGSPAGAAPAPAPCPRPAACSSWRGSWLSGQSCLQHPPRMSPVSMSARLGTARLGMARPGQPAGIIPSPGVCWGGGRGREPDGGRAQQHPSTQPWGWRQHLPPRDSSPRPTVGPADPAPTHALHLCLAAKAGVCPDPATEAVNCTVGCQSDGDCESTLKCCPAACGKACQKPDGNAPSCSWPLMPGAGPAAASQQPILASGTDAPGRGSGRGPGCPLRVWLQRGYRGLRGDPGRVGVCSHGAVLTPSSLQRHGG